MSVSATRAARIQITADASKMGPGIADAKRQLRTFQREQARGSKQQEREAKQSAKAQEKAKSRVMSGANSLAGTLAGGVGMALGADAIGGLQGAVSAALDFDRAMTRLQINGEATTAQTDEFRTAILATSRATGVSVDEIQKGEGAYLRFTGNVKYARASLDLLAKTTRATGASAEDIGGIFATFDKNLNLDPSQWSEAMDILVKQAHVGGVELVDLAKDFAPVVSMFATGFSGGNSLNGLSEVSAMAQTLQNFTHDAALTNTYLKDMFQDIGKNADKFRDLKIEPFTVDPKTKKKVLKDGFDLLDQLSKTAAAKDPEILKKLFPEIRSNETAKYLLENLDAVHQIASESLNSNQVAKDFDVIMSSASGKIDTAWNSIKVSIAEALTPERAQAFADIIKGAAEEFGDGIHMFGGPSKEEGTKGGALSFVNIQQEQGEDAAVAAAKKALTDDPFDTKVKGGSLADSLANQMRQQAMMSSTGGLENYQAGARAYLASQSSYQPGTDSSKWAARAHASIAAGDVDTTAWGSGGPGTVSPTAGGMLAGSDGIGSLARAIGMEVAKAMAATPPPVTKIGNETIAASAANSRNFRRMP